MRRPSVRMRKFAPGPEVFPHIAIIVSSNDSTLSDSVSPVSLVSPVSFGFACVVGITGVEGY